MTSVDKFVWRIENFSKLTGTAAIYSDIFLLKGLQWKILLNPVGICKCLSAYLEFVDSKLVPDRWRLVVDFGLILVDQLNNGSSSMRISTAGGQKGQFEKGKREGYRFNAEIGELLQRGFLVNDTLIIEAEVSTIRFIDPNLSAKLYTALETLDTRLSKQSSRRTLPIFGPYSLECICRSIPATRKELEYITGVGKDKSIKYGDQVLETIESTISEYYSDFCKHEGITSVSKEVVESVAKHPFTGDSASPPLSNKVARTSTTTSPCSLTVQLASKNLIGELSAMARDWKPCSVDITPDSTTDDNHDSALLQQQRDKLAEYFEMSLEEISKAGLYYDVQQVVRKICELASDPFERSVMKDLHVT